MINALAQWMARRRLDELRRLAASPRAAQRRSFDYLLHRARETSFGREHSLARVQTYHDFTRAVPLRDYAGMAPWWSRAMKGEADVCWPGRVRHWAISSGTTSGEKYLPVSVETIRASRRAGFDAIAPCVAQSDPRLLSGKLLFLGGCTSLRKQDGVWIGDNTGILARHIPRLFRHWHTPGRRVAAMANWEAKIRKAAAISRHQDVRMISGVPSWICLFAQEVLAQAGRDTLLEVWPNLKLFVHGGMAFAPYRAWFEQLAGGRIWCTDTYSASEGGMLAVQDRATEPDMLPLCDYGVFYEFVPARELDQPNPARVRLHEVDAGVDYAVVLSTDSGIFGYLVGDIVRFTSLKPIRLVFVGRVKHTLSAFGEHVSGGELDRAIETACVATGARVTEFAVATAYPGSERTVGGHLWYVEFRADRPDLTAFARALDQCIASGNEDYACHRKDGFGMAEPVVHPLPVGAFYNWLASKGRVGGQNKVPRVLTREQETELAGHAGTQSGRLHEAAAGV